MMATLSRDLRSITPDAILAGKCDPREGEHASRWELVELVLHGSPAQHRAARMRYDQLTSLRHPPAELDPPIQAPSERRSEHRDTPALDAWRKRVARDGVFGPYDALWLAACWEASALTAPSERARQADFDKATEVLRGR